MMDEPEMMIDSSEAEPPSHTVVNQFVEIDLTDEPTPSLRVSSRKRSSNTGTRAYSKRYLETEKTELTQKLHEVSDDLMKVKWLRENIRNGFFPPESVLETFPHQSWYKDYFAKEYSAEIKNPSRNPWGAFQNLDALKGYDLSYVPHFIFEDDGKLIVFRLKSISAADQHLFLQFKMCRDNLPCACLEYFLENQLREYLNATETNDRTKTVMLCLPRNMSPEFKYLSLKAFKNLNDLNCIFRRVPRLDFTRSLSNLKLFSFGAMDQTCEDITIQQRAVCQIGRAVGHFFDTLKLYPIPSSRKCILDFMALGTFHNCDILLSLDPQSATIGFPPLKVNANKMTNATAQKLYSKKISDSSVAQQLAVTVSSKASQSARSHAKKDAEVLIMPKPAVQVAAVQPVQRVQLDLSKEAEVPSSKQPTVGTEPTTPAGKQYGTIRVAQNLIDPARQKRNSGNAAEELAATSNQLGSPSDSVLKAVQGRVVDRNGSRWLLVAGQVIPVENIRSVVALPKHAVAGSTHCVVGTPIANLPPDLVIDRVQDKVVTTDSHAGIRVPVILQPNAVNSCSTGVITSSNVLPVKDVQAIARAVSTVTNDRSAEAVARKTTISTFRPVDGMRSLKAAGAAHKPTGAVPSPRDVLKASVAPAQTQHLQRLLQRPLSQSSVGAPSFPAEQVSQSTDLPSVPVGHNFSVPTVPSAAEMPVKHHFKPGTLIQLKDATMVVHTGSVASDTSAQSYGGQRALGIPPLFSSSIAKNQVSMPSRGTIGALNDDELSSFRNFLGSKSYLTGQARLMPVTIVEGESGPAQPHHRIEGNPKTVGGVNQHAAQNDLANRVATADGQPARTVLASAARSPDSYDEYRRPRFTGSYLLLAEDKDGCIDESDVPVLHLEDTEAINSPSSIVSDFTDASEGASSMVLCPQTGILFVKSPEGWVKKSGVNGEKGGVPTQKDLTTSDSQCSPLREESGSGTRFVPSPVPEEQLKTTVLEKKHDSVDIVADWDFSPEKAPKSRMDYVAHDEIVLAPVEETSCDISTIKAEIEDELAGSNPLESLICRTDVQTDLEVSTQKTESFSETGDDDRVSAEISKDKQCVSDAVYVIKKEKTDTPAPIGMNGESWWEGAALDKRYNGINIRVQTRIKVRPEKTQDSGSAVERVPAGTNEKLPPCSSSAQKALKKASSYTATPNTASISQPARASSTSLEKATKLKVLTRDKGDQRRQSIDIDTPSSNRGWTIPGKTRLKKKKQKIPDKMLRATVLLDRLDPALVDLAEKGQFIYGKTPLFPTPLSILKGSKNVTVDPSNRIRIGDHCDYAPRGSKRRMTADLSLIVENNTSGKRALRNNEPPVKRIPPRVLDLKKAAKSRSVKKTFTAKIMIQNSKPKSEDKNPVKPIDRKSLLCSDVKFDRPMLSFSLLPDSIMPVGKEK